MTHLCPSPGPSGSGLSSSVGLLKKSFLFAEFLAKEHLIVLVHDIFESDPHWTQLSGDTQSG
jgi:hypothetical protein